MAHGARQVSRQVSAVFATLATLAPATMACGPSFQAIYEGDQRFEHCYALDDNPGAPVPDKGNCWRDWMQNYTFGQTRDRVEYAAVRQRALSRDAMPTDEAMMAAAPGQGAHSVATPAPTSAFAPPPKTMGDADPRGSPAPTLASSVPAPAGSVVFVTPSQPLPPKAGAAAPPPGADCQDACDRAWQSCGANPDKADKPGAKPDANHEGPCGKTYRACMRGCFK
jgi:hypothetical protein